MNVHLKTHALLFMHSLTFFQAKRERRKVMPHFSIVFCILLFSNQNSVCTKAIDKTCQSQMKHLKSLETLTHRLLHILITDRLQQNLLSQVVRKVDVFFVIHLTIPSLSGSCYIASHSDEFEIRWSMTTFIKKFQ